MTESTLLLIVVSGLLNLYCAWNNFKMARLLKRQADAQAELHEWTAYFSSGPR